MRITNTEKETDKNSNSLFFGHIAWRLRKKKNYTIAITGLEPTGITKSSLGRVIARKLSPVFSASRIIFDLEEFYSFFDFLMPGDPWILDEAGVDLDNQLWMTLFQRMFKYITQTYRFRQVISILVLPNLGMLTVNERKLLNGTLHLFEDGRAGWSRFETGPEGEINSTPVGILDFDAPDETDPFEIEYEKKKRQSFEVLKTNARLELMAYKLKKPAGMYSVNRIERLTEKLADAGVDIEDSGVVQKIISPKTKTAEEEKEEEDDDEQEELEEKDFLRPPWER